MPISTTYTIKNTQGNLSFTINVGSASGPLELQQNADLTFYGYGRTGWGQEVDQNFYRLLENFAVQELTSTPKRPKTKTQLGGILGINKPVIGQTWYNLSDSELYICSNNTTLGSETWRHLITDEFAVTKYLQINDASGTGPNAFIKLNGSNTPTTGFIELIDTPPSATWHAAPKGYVDDEITALRTEADGKYVERAGDVMSGGLLITGGSIAGHDTSTAYIPNQGPHVVIRSTTSEGGSTDTRNIVMGLGATDSSTSNPHIDFHSSGGNIDYDSSIIASGGNSSVAGQGTLTLVGFAMVDRTPTLTNQISSKGYVDTSINTAINNLTTSSNNLYVKKAGDTMTGILNMNGNRITNVAYPVAATDPARVDWVRAGAYMPAGYGASNEITSSTAGPYGGSDGDIWLQYY